MGAVDDYDDTQHGVEKRRAPRVRDRMSFALAAHADCQPPRSIGPAIVFSTTEDISEGGLQFQHQSGFAVGTLLKVFLIIPETLLSIRRTATVTWCRQIEKAGRFATGLCFASGPEAGDSWAAYVRAKENVDNTGAVFAR